MIMEGNGNLGQAIKAYRDRNKMTQQEFGKLLGVSVNTVYLWEKKGHRPSVGSMMQLSEILNIPFSALTAGIRNEK